MYKIVDSTGHFLGQGYKDAGDALRRKQDKEREAAQASDLGWESTRRYGRRWWSENNAEGARQAVGAINVRASGDGDCEENAPKPLPDASSAGWL